MAIAIVALGFAGIISCYTISAQRAEWTGQSFAAQSLASQGAEQVRAAKWDPQAWPVVDELPPTNFFTVEPLDIPRSGQPVYATNYIAITDVSTNPPLRQIRVDCVWLFAARRPFTNTMITFRAADQ